MITPSYGLTATERVLPRLALDWTTGLAQPGVDVTRAGAATFVSSNGLIQSATADTQRIDWSTGTAGLLVEESRTNIISHSEDFSVWTASNISVLTDQITAPDGNQTADKIITDNAATSGNVLQFPSFTYGVNNTGSVFAKAGEWNWLAIELRGTDGVGRLAAFDLANGVVGFTGVGVSASIKHYGDGWYRCTATRVLTAGASSSRFRIYSTNQNLTSDAGPFSTGDGSSGIYIWGAQAEAGAFPTSYIPTTTTAVTRNADVATMTGTNFSDWFNASEGTLYAQGSRFGTSNVFPRLAQCDDGTDNSVINVFVNSSANTGGGSVAVSGATSASYSGFNVGGTNATGKVALAYKQDSFGFAANSTGGTPDTLGNLPTVNSLILGARRSGPAYLNGHIQKIQYWSIRLTQSELNAFTK